MVTRKEAFSILQGYTPKNKKDEIYAISHRLAHSTKAVRREHIIKGEDNLERLISAALEISRTWRGYRYRKSTKQGKNRKNQNITLEKRVFTRNTAAVIIQRAWRKHIDTQVFRYYRDLINFRGRGNPSMMLRCINPNEAKLLDAAAGVHVRFRLAGEKFPPNIYYKIYTHRSVVDMCANSPKDYTKVASKQKCAREIHNRFSPTAGVNEKDGWYERFENNGWRLVSDRLIHLSMDSVTWETSRKKLSFHHAKIQRKADVEQKRRKRKIDWMKKMYNPGDTRRLYMRELVMRDHHVTTNNEHHAAAEDRFSREGMLKSRETDEDTKHLVEKAARGLVNTVQVQGSEAVMDWEVDELLQWTTALNFDDYLETWKESATSTISEVDVPGMRYSHPHNSSSGALPVTFDPYALTRASSMGVQPHQHTEVPSASTRVPESSDAQRSPGWKSSVGGDSRRAIQQST